MLPPELQAALERELHAAHGSSLRRASAGLSHRYREQHGRSTSRVVRGEEDVLAYAAFRLPATYAAIRASLRSLHERVPDWTPFSLLDVGAGPGTAAWAAADSWSSLERITLIERDEGMIRLGRSLAANARTTALGSANWQRLDVAGPWQTEPADLVIIGYVMGELEAGERAVLIQRAWNHALGACVVVEPGTPRGSEIVRAATEELNHLGAQIAAPFPCDWVCVEGPNDWCHFSERVPRSRVHRAVKAVELAYEDEKYSYVAATRMPSRPIAATVTRHPQIRAGHIRLDLCTPNGIKRVIVTKKDREAFRRARGLRWGSAIDVDDAPLFGL